MDGLLTPVSTTYKSDEPLLQEVKGTNSSSRHKFQASSPEEALKCLKSEPDYETLVSILKYIVTNDEISIGTTSPLSAQFIVVLTNAIVPNYWVLLNEDADDSQDQDRSPTTTPLNLLLRCLRCLGGVNAALNQLTTLISEAKKDPARLSESALNLKIFIQLISALLAPDSSIRQLWAASAKNLKPMMGRPLAQMVISTIGSGKIVALTAEAEDLVKKSATTAEYIWLADRKQYSGWLIRNVVHWASQDPDAADLKLSAQLLLKAIQLDQSNTNIKLLLTRLFLSPHVDAAKSLLLLNSLTPGEQRRVLYDILKVLPTMFLGSGSLEDQSAPIASVAGLIATIIQDGRRLREDLVSWLIRNADAGLGEGVGIRRAVLAVVSPDIEGLSTVLEKAIAQFGNTVYIQRTAMLEQEALVQTLLLSAGYVHRLKPMKLVVTMRGGDYLRTISNRLAASQNRARFLGMVVGEALSSLVDTTEKKLDFHLDELDSDEAEWYKSLVKISDTIGSLEKLQAPVVPEPPPKEPQKPQKTPVVKPIPRKATTPRPTGFVIEELEDDEDGDDDVTPYAKPDSDVEDSDDDATMVRRDKPKAPVYVRDLIVYLRDTENYERQKLALTTAPVLIRRKANYGTEVKEHAEELASLLVGLQDKFDLEDFYNLRIQAMMALIIAQPKVMGQWFARTFFEGDYSISQRASVLTVLGLSARELAGFETSDYATEADFPSKKLPDRMEKLYLEPSTSSQRPQSTLKALPPSALDSIAKSLTSNFLAPSAAKAADTLTGPDALKLSSFTSRLQAKDGTVTKSKGKSGVRVIPNTTAQLISTSFFFPLTARFQNALQSRSGRNRGILFQPFLLSLYLKTLALLLHAAGPSTLALPDMTAEFWAVLLGSTVQAHCIGDVTITHAVLFGLLTLLDVNENRMRDLCRDMGREVVQTQGWVSQVFEATRGGDGGEENEVKMLAAGILIRLNEGMEKYRNLLMGNMIG